MRKTNHDQIITHAPWGRRALITHLTHTHTQNHVRCALRSGELHSSIQGMAAMKHTHKLQSPHSKSQTQVRQPHREGSVTRSSRWRNATERYEGLEVYHTDFTSCILHLHLSLLADTFIQSALQ